MAKVTSCILRRESPLFTVNRPAQNGTSARLSRKRVHRFPMIDYSGDQSRGIRAACPARGEPPVRVRRSPAGSATARINRIRAAFCGQPGRRRHNPAVFRSCPEEKRRDNHFTPSVPRFFAQKAANRGHAGRRRAGGVSPPRSFSRSDTCRRIPPACRTGSGSFRRRRTNRCGRLPG